MSATSTPRTVGVEEEFLLFHPDAPRLADVGPSVADSAEGAAGTGGQFEKELKTAQVELGSAPATSLAELSTDLRGLRADLAAAAARRGARLVATGTCPVVADPDTTDDDRYHQMSDAFGEIERQQLTCAMHVHVGVSSRAEGIAALDDIAPWLSVLLALSVNSPLHAGRDTGYASYRRVLWDQWPSSGPTAPLHDLAAYDALTEELIATGAARDDGMIYFDARLSARYPTVELRVCDVCPDVEDAVTVAALARALVTTAAGSPGTESVRPELLRAAAWRAAREGMDGQLVDLTRAAGTGALVPAWTLVDALVERVTPALDGAGDTGRVRDGLSALRSRRTGAWRQREAATDGGLAAAVDAVTVTAP